VVFVQCSTRLHFLYSDPFITKMIVAITPLSGHAIPHPEIVPIGSYSYGMRHKNRSIQLRATN
jgi:hypothetical protein